VAARRDAFHRWLRYESLEERCLLSIGDKVVSILATDAAAGDATGTGTYEISRTGSTTSPLAVNLYASGSALQGVDYTLSDGAGAVNNQVTIPAGQLSVDVT